MKVHKTCYTNYSFKTSLQLNVLHIHLFIDFQWFDAVSADVKSHITLDIQIMTILSNSERSERREATLASEL